MWWVPLALARIDCPIGWGQSNHDNIRLRIQKEWTRVCLSYCWVMTTDDPAHMERLVGGSWDEQDFYRSFWIKGCGGMFGTDLHDDPFCGDVRPVNVDRHGRTVRPVDMHFSCCNKYGGCDSASSVVPGFFVTVALIILILNPQI